MKWFEAFEAAKQGATIRPKNANKGEYILRVNDSFVLCGPGKKGDYYHLSVEQMEVGWEFYGTKEKQITEEE